MEPSGHEHAEPRAEAMPEAMPEAMDAAEAPRPAWRDVPPMRYENAYVWFVFVSSLDIILTWRILAAGGREVNPVAKLVIDFWDLPGAVGFKFSLTVFVIIVCEIVGRTRDRFAHAFAWLAVCISAAPVVYSIFLILTHIVVKGLRLA